MPLLNFLSAQTTADSTQPPTMPESIKHWDH